MCVGVLWKWHSNIRAELPTVRPLPFVVGCLTALGHENHHLHTLLPRVPTAPPLPPPLPHFPRQLSTIFAVLIAVAVVRWLSTANTASWLYFFVFTTKSEPEPDTGSTARGLKYLARWFRFASERYLGNSPSVSSVERGSARKRPQMDNESVHGAPRRPDVFLTSAMSVASACTACTVCRLSF